MPGSMFAEMESVSDSGGNEGEGGGGGTVSGVSGGGGGGGGGGSGAPDAAAGTEEDQKSLRLALDHLSILGLAEEGDGLLGEGGGGGGAGVGGAVMVGEEDDEDEAEDEGGVNGLAVSLFHPPLVPPPPPPLFTVPGDPGRRKSVNMTECVPVPSSEHVAEIVGRQGCKIKALRAKTNTYIKTPVRGEEPVFIVTGRKEDVAMAKREILSAAEHFSMIRASRNKTNGLAGTVTGSPNLPGQTTIQVRVPYRVVGLVVGPKGATIKRIQQTTHTYIVTPSRDKEPVFEVTGMPENVDRAREEIEAHISMRTGVLIDLTADNDFHSNGTDVSLDGISTTGNLWSKAPNPARRPAASFRNDSLSSLGSTSTDSYYSNRLADTSPTSPFSTGSGGFTFGESLNSVNSDERDVGMEYPAIDCLSGPHSMIWSPFEHGNPIQAFNGASAVQRRTNSISGSSTLRVSPTVSDSTALDHPLARRVQSDPLANLAWLPNQTSLSAFSNSPGYSSSSLPGSTSATSGSPTDSSGSESRLKNNRDCVVCRESEVIAALVPCGHNYFCMECANRICEKAEPKCPVCQKPASQAIRIFS
ncbi:RNA-binding protein MEX3B-like [Hemitrygon akajei]|uniref:RNA-binding protein MEX3B-like n=1 Tax=Hemitrygon akajei TaxID=2704970 RepID=UPI003BFA3308